MPEHHTPNPQQPTDTVEWNGLSELSPAQREELASGIAPLVSEHLEQCLEGTLKHWKAKEATGTKEEDPREWALDLARSRPRIQRDFRDAVANDLRALDHTRAYAFSGIEFANDDSSLQLLDDYQSSRRSLRHELESLFRAEHGYSYFILAQAARERDRFQYVNFAPWSPLNWFERLFEAAELYLGRGRTTLEFMASYIQCVEKKGAQLLATVVEIVEGCGLVEDASLSFESEIRREHAASWANFRQAGAAAGNASLVGDDQHAAPQSRHPPSEGANATFIAAQSSSPTIPIPDSQAGGDSWTRWARTLLNASREGTGRRAGQAPGFHGNAGAGAGRNTGDGPGGRSEGTSGLGQQPAGRGNHQPGATYYAVPEGLGSAAILAPPGFGILYPSPGPGASPDGEDLDSVLGELLDVWLEEILEEVGFHSVVADRIRSVAGPVTQIIVSDLTFFHDRSHPLRIWLGDLINKGARISPHAADTDHNGVTGLLDMIDEFSSRLRESASDMDQGAQQQFLHEWRESTSSYDDSWLRSQEGALQSFLEAERRSRAQRGLTVCVLETGADLPQDAAEEIIDAWDRILGMGQEDGELGADTKAIVSAICEKCQPQEVAPKVRRMFEDAGELGIDGNQIRTVINLLGTAHLKHTRSPVGAPRFSPQENIRKRRSVRCPDDDPDLLGEQDDVHVYEASRMRVGLWYETVDRGTGQLERLALVWRGEASRRFAFASLDGRTRRCHSLQGAAHEMREGRLRPLPVDNILDAILR